LLAGIVSARLAYVAHYPSAFASNPGSLVSLNLNLFEPLWGIIFGLLTSSLYAWRKKLPLLHTLDALTSGFAFFAIAIHLAHFASGDAYGTPTNLPWAIELWGTRRHPVQIYEFVAAIFIFGLVWPRPAWFRIAGQRFIVFIALSAGARLFMEAFRDDGTLWGRYRSAQVIAWMLLAICLWIYKKVKKTYDD
jgi:phosphatidylglycerol:prolipoprotein diacylglycerol transferase